MKSKITELRKLNPIECSFRYNNRKSDKPMFITALESLKD